MFVSYSQLRCWGILLLFQTWRSVSDGWPRTTETGRLVSSLCERFNLISSRNEKFESAELARSEILFHRKSKRFSDWTDESVGGTVVIPFRLRSSSVRLLRFNNRLGMAVSLLSYKLRICKLSAPYERKGSHTKRLRTCNDSCLKFSNRSFRFVWWEAQRDK